jgi:glycosyltransferase involved in cell wall biosynthesis
VIDSGSNPALKAEDLNPGRNLPMRVIRVDEPGLILARRFGIRQSVADVLVMVDDDNILDPDYLEIALTIARCETTLGAFGGIARAQFEAKTPPIWKHRLLEYLGIRDFGETPITSNEDRWGKWEPIGAGMVLRKDVAKKFIELVDHVPLAASLGHNGTGLLAGDDSLMARAAYRLGYSCSYQPRLKLSHFIRQTRLKSSYLIRLLFGQGRSTILLNCVLGIQSDPLRFQALLGRLRYRRAQDGWAGVIVWAWDVGYFLEIHRHWEAV